MEPIDGDPQSIAPGVIAQLTHRERVAVARIAEHRGFRPVYGLPEPEVRAELRRYPSYDQAAAAARRTILDGVRNANLVWATPAWVGLTLTIALCAQIRTMPTIVLGLSLICVLAALIIRPVRRLIEVRRWCDTEIARGTNDEDLSQAGDRAALPSNVTRPPNRRLIPRWAAATGLLLGVVVFGLASSDVWEVRGWPRETATLLAAPETHPPYDRSCGRGGGLPRDFTWRSSNPPTGYPRRSANLTSVTRQSNPGTSRPSSG